MMLPGMPCGEIQAMHFAGAHDEQSSRQKLSISFRSLVSNRHSMGMPQQAAHKLAATVTNSTASASSLSNCSAMHPSPQQSGELVISANDGKQLVTSTDEEWHRPPVLIPARLFCHQEQLCRHQKYCCRVLNTRHSMRCWPHPLALQHHP